MSLFNSAISLTLPLVPKPLVRFFSKRYIAGESIDDALGVVRALRNEGALATLDILGEFISTADEARANTEDYLKLIERVRADGLEQAHISVKLTALGLLIDPVLCLELMRRLVGAAADAGNFVRIDMEDAPCTDATLAIHDALADEFPGHIGCVLQSRLRRTIDDVERLSRRPANVRLCKGIYLEPRSIAYTDAELIRRNFSLALHRLLVGGAYVGIATHDELLVWESLRLIRKHGLGRDDFEFQMLLGVDEQLRRVLIDAGHKLRVYVPFGPSWYQYSVRRLRENPQIAGYALRAIFRRERKQLNPQQPVPTAAIVAAARQREASAERPTPEHSAH